MTDDEFRDLVEQEHLLADLEKHPGWSVLCDTIRSDTEARNRRLLAGQAKTLEEYRDWAGWIRGATAAIDVPKTAAQAVEMERQRRREAQAA